MTKLEQVLQRDKGDIGFYLEEVEADQFICDVRELMAAYSDNGVIDRAVELLQSCRTTN